ncbi:MAG: hypothetical protein NTZ93_03960 [Candidatus Beckwithbacteria bacterium]|nr:hypothetical protein [Candidatus Beckwithbacteria bacterium]
MIKRRKNYLPTLLLVLILWALLGLMLYFVEPAMVKDILIPGLYLPFFLLFFPASSLTLGIIFNNSLRGLLLAIGITAWLILKVYQLDNWLNIILISGIIITVDRYLST